LRLYFRKKVATESTESTEGEERYQPPGFVFLCERCNLCGSIFFIRGQAELGLDMQNLLKRMIYFAGWKINFLGEKIFFLAEKIFFLA